MPEHKETLRLPFDPQSLGQHLSTRPWHWRYGAAIGCVVLGWLAREALTPLIGTTALPYIFFFPAVAGAAWFGGLAPGVFAILLACMAARFFFIVPIYSLEVANPTDLVSDFAFLMSCAFIVGAIGAMHQARQRFVHEIVERERVTLELAHARDSLATTLASIGDGVIVTDADGRVTFLNAEAERLTHWKNREAEGQPLETIFRIINEHTRAPVENPAEKALRIGRSVGLVNHTVLIAKDGTETPIDDSASPIRRDGGTPFGVVVVFRDVSEPRKADAARTRLAAIVENSGDAILTKGLTGQIETWNAGAERLFGYRAAEIIGQSITLLVPPEYLQEEYQILERLRAGLPSERIETVRLAKDGRRLDVSISVSPLRDREGTVTGASTIIHDISKRKEAEEELMKTKERLVTELIGMQRLHELSTLLLKETDLPAMLRQVLDASVELLRAQKGIVQIYEPADETIKVVAQVGFTADFVRQFASVPVASDFVSTVALRQKQRVIVEDFATDPTFAHLRAGGAPHGIVAAQSTPLFAGNGEVFGVLSTHFGEPHRPSESELRLLDLYAHQAERVIDHHRANDVVQAAQAKLARANIDLENTVRERTAELQAMVSELEHVSYAITHDMRAPLRAMANFAQILLEEAATHQLPAEAQDYCRRIMTGANRLDTLIREALHYTRTVLQRLPMRPVDLDKLVRELIETYPNLHPEKADIRIEGSLPAVQGNESLLTQCFSNLLGNAVKFVPPGRKAHVRVWADEAAPMARIFVEDNGIGIPRHAQPRLFGMFQKLDNQYEGTGIGLAIVRKVVEQMGGKIGVESEANQGSRFWVELPRAETGQTP
jgi:PAS domain S-box-containing protein